MLAWSGRVLAADHAVHKGGESSGCPVGGARCGGATASPGSGPGDGCSRKGRYSPSMEFLQESNLDAGAYFGLLLERAIAAGADGNYAISAALSIREAGTELVTIGTNTVFRFRDPSGHAEMNAIRLAYKIGLCGTDAPSREAAVSDGDVLVRGAPDDLTDTVLFTTLEPCPMCTVCIINAGIRRVVIAAEDPPSGSLSPHGLRSLPPLWPELAQTIGLEVAFCQSRDASDVATYVQPELRDELISVFLASRQPLDAALAAEGVLDVHAIHAHATANRSRVLTPHGHTSR